MSNPTLPKDHHLGVSGASEEIAAIETLATEAGVTVRELTVSHAFHSPLMEPMLTAFHKVVWVKRYVVVDRALGTLKLYKGAKAPAAGAKARSALPLNSCALNLNAQGPKKSDALTLLEFASQERFTLSAPVGHGGLAAFLADPSHRFNQQNLNSNFEKMVN